MVPSNEMKRLRHKQNILHSYVFCCLFFVCGLEG